MLNGQEDSKALITATDTKASNKMPLLVYNWAINTERADLKACPAAIDTVTRAPQRAASTAATTSDYANDELVQVLAASVAGIDTSSSDHPTRMKSKAYSEEYNRIKQVTAAAVCALTTGSAVTRSSAFTGVKTAQVEVHDDKDELARLLIEMTFNP